jgi:demethylmacrocin O-methyltransferase
MKTLDELANKYNTDKGSQYSGPSRHGYAPIYDEYLNKWKSKNIKMLEVGVCMEGTEGGHSIYMWNEYFENAKIYTFDIVDMSNHPSVSQNDNVFFFKGDQGERNDFISMYQSFGNENFDFILEDGSHEVHHQIISLGHLFKYVKPGGFYILEDMSIPNRPVCCIRNDETYSTISEFAQTGKIQSSYLTEDEIIYLQENVEKIEIHHDCQEAYAVAILIKKQ